MNESQQRMKVYHKISILLLICGISFTAYAQQRANDVRTNETKIADVVMMLPAKDTEMQKQLMQELIGLDNVIPSLASKLLPSGEGNDSQVRAAISGLAFYASQGNNPADKKKVAEELSKALSTAKSDEIKDFLSMQLQFFAGDDSIESVAPYLENPRKVNQFMQHINQITFSNSTNAQKLLLLRDALDISQTPEQKVEIINEIAKTGTFLGMVTAKKYLDDSNEDVRKAADQAVNTIALAHPDYKNYVSIFNGKDLSGWQGLVDNPILRTKMKPDELAAKQAKANEIMRQDWKVENGMLVYEGKGYDNLCSTKNYGDIEMYVDWKIAPDGDAGVYLRGSPQVQIWDTSRTDVGAQVGSGGLYNNQKYQSKPLVVADNPVNEWNSFYIRMEGDKVTVYLNGQLVTDNVILENYWDRSLPIFPEGAIELQAHGNRVEYRDIYVREIPHPQPYEVPAAEKKEGFVPLFNGINLTGWVGNLKDYFAKEGMIICDPERGGHGNLYTEKEYSDFILRFEFQLTPAANNGIGIRAPLEGDAAYVGMELQILDNEAEIYKDLHTYQYHGSVYGVIPAKRGYLKPVGEWNYEEVIAKGNHITITLNGTVILDGDIAEASKNFTATIDGNPHPGLSNKTGHIGFLGHGSWVAFKNLRIKELAH